MNPCYHKVLGSVALITSLAVAAPTRAQEANAIAVATLKSQGLAEGPGLAAQFPGDEAIERDPRVLFVEDFESGAIRELGDRWGNATQPENLSFSPDIPPNSPGNRSLRVAKTGLRRAEAQYGQRRPAWWTGPFAEAGHGFGPARRPAICSHTRGAWTECMRAFT